MMHAKNITKLAGHLALILSLLLSSTSFAEPRVPCEVAIQKCNNALLATEDELKITKQALGNCQKQREEADVANGGLPWYFWALAGAASVLIIEKVRQ